MAAAAAAAAAAALIVAVAWLLLRGGSGVRKRREVPRGAGPAGGVGRALHREGPECHHERHALATRRARDGTAPGEHAVQEVPLEEAQAVLLRANEVPRCGHGRILQSLRRDEGRPPNLLVFKF